MALDPYRYKQALIVRRDLNMTRGKEISQGAHASMITLIENPDDPRMKAWLNSPFAKISLSCPTEDEMLRIEAAAKSRGLITAMMAATEDELLDVEIQAKAKGMITAMVTDQGRTMFNGVPTRTVLAVGPDRIEEIDAVCGHLKLR